MHCAETPEVDTPGTYQEHVGVDYIPAQPLGPDNFFNVTSNEVEVTVRTFQNTTVEP